MKVLVPIDFSDASKSATRYAVELAKKLRGNITLLSVIGYNDHGMLVNWKKLAKSEKDAATQSAQELIGQLILGEVSIEHQIVSGHPLADQICDYAVLQKMDLIVMGTHGSSLRKFIGSNTQNVMAKSDIPVIAVPTGYTFAGIQKIVYATDKQNISTEVSKAANFANLFDAELMVLHVRPAQSKQGLSKLTEPELVNLTEFSRLSYHEEKSDNIGNAIRLFAKSHHTDLLAVFSHEASFTKKLLGKSTTQNLTAQIETPIISF